MQNGLKALLRKIYARAWRTSSVMTGTLTGFAL